MTKKPSKETEELEKKLTLKQQLFCKYYLFWNKEPKVDRGNATRCYMLAHWKEEKDYDSCNAEWSKTLAKPNIKAYQRQLLEDAGFNDNFADSMLLEWMKNWDIQFLKEYNNLMQRITKKLELGWKVDLTTKDVDKKSLEELKDNIQLLLNQ